MVAELAAEGIPQLAAGGDPTRLALSPAEGYLLSRIDGVTCVAALRQIGGLPPAEVDRCLAHWIGEGVIELGGAAAGRRPGRASDAVASAPPRTDPSLDVSVEFQERILAFEQRMDRSYHEILGVEATASQREVKQAYFALSREFHPDRYFRKQLGAFAPRIELIFKRVLEAYELLCDPTARAEVEQSLAESPAAAPRQKRLALTRHGVMGQKARLIARRRAKAKGFFEAGMAAFAEQRWLEAASAVRLAIAFDPGNDAVRDQFATVQRRAHEERAQQLLKEAASSYDLRHFDEALELYEEALHYRPHDATANHRAAMLAWKIADDLRRAKDYATAACELEPEDGSHHRLLGQVYRAAGLLANARRELRMAVRLDGSDQEARAELKSLPRHGRGEKRIGGNE